MLEPGQIIDGKYEIVRLLGEGGMGAVFEARNTRIHRRVAIKVLHASVREAPDVVKRFEREAQAAGCIGSDHILEVLDLGALPSSDRYMVLEFLDGETVAERIKRKGTLDPSEVRDLLRQALTGLAAAHDAGIVHRDLKPDNLFILKKKAGHKDFVKIIDFGISKFGALTGDLALTSTGTMMGTPYYMSPEQAKGAGAVDHQSDIYSMGVIAFEALTGRVPFDGQTFNELMFKIVLNHLPDIAEIRPDLDAGFAAIVHKALAKDKSQRYQSANEFRADLVAWAPGGATLSVGTNNRFRASESGKQDMSADAGHARTLAPPASEEAPIAGLPQPTKKPLAVVAVVLVLAALGGGVFFMKGGDAQPEESTLEAEPTEAIQAAEVPKIEDHPAPSPAPVPTPAPVAPSDEAEDSPPEPKPIKAAPEVAPKPPAPVARPKLPPSAPQPRSSPKPKPKPTSKPAKTQRDFGY